MLTHKLHKYNMSSATKLRVMMTPGEQAARMAQKVKRWKELRGL
jgi:hypothetical protein